MRSRIHYPYGTTVLDHTRSRTRVLSMAEFSLGTPITILQNTSVAMLIFFHRVRMDQTAGCWHGFVWPRISEGTWFVTLSRGLGLALPKWRTKTRVCFLNAFRILLGVCLPAEPPSPPHGRQIRGNITRFAQPRPLCLLFMTKIL
jgi:hypothetical protein